MLIYETPDPAASGKGSSSKTNIFLVMKTLEISDDAIRKDKNVSGVVLCNRKAQNTDGAR